MKAVRVPDLACLRCGHHWVPRGRVIKICPRCKSRLWDVPKKPA
jgi:predicted Zn-ribbon and HTH transcriptional regulator